MDEQQWLEKLYEDNFRLLYHIGRTFLTASPDRTGRIEEEIHEVFLLALQKRDKLLKHPNPGGWLVEAMRKRLLADFRKWRREQKHLAFSLDGQSLPITPSTGEEVVFEATADKARQQALDRLLGPEDARLFTLFCVERVPARELTEQFSMTEACIRMRASRIRKKVLSHPEIFIAVVFLLALRF